MSANNIVVQVEPQYLPEQSNPQNNQYLFAYTVRITNRGSIAAQLVSRRWVITDANQQIHQVGGLGVVGKQPLLAPGESFSYTSGCPLQTSVGSMYGTYYFAAENGSIFEVPINEFVLAAPQALH